MTDRLYTAQEVTTIVKRRLQQDRAERARTGVASATSVAAMSRGSATKELTDFEVAMVDWRKLEADGVKQGGTVVAHVDVGRERPFRVLIGVAEVRPSGKDMRVRVTGFPSFLVDITSIQFSHLE